VDNSELKKTLSQKTNQILELTEKLDLATQTITDLEQRLSAKPQSEALLEEALVKQAEDKEEEDGDIQVEDARVAQLEEQVIALQDELEQSKQKARDLLIKKDLQEEKLKVVIVKLEAHMKQKLGIPQFEVNKIGQLTEEELIKFQESEQYEQEIANIEDKLLQGVGSQIVVDKHALEEYKKQLESDSINIEYLRNVFVKYLEYLTTSNSKEIKTLENVLFTVLRISKEQSIRLDHLRKQNSFWRKLLFFTGTQTTVKGKFSAGNMKKKLFGRGGSPQKTARESLNFSMSSPTLGFESERVNQTVVHEVRAQDEEEKQQDLFGRH